MFTNETGIMAKLVFMLAFVIGVAILAIAATAEPKADGLMLRASSDARAMSVTKGSCAMREISLDEGYGVSRKIYRRVCRFDD
jgi:hypothetical protein